MNIYIYIMNKAYIFLPVAAIALCSHRVMALTEQPDSAASPSIELQEVVVVGERAWFEGDKAVFIPTKSEKNLANDPVSLVRNMHIPTVITDQGSIKSLSGESVSIFINGVPATGVDISTFWPKQALRVEYMENPSDPKYQGAKAVLNFVMEEYVYGGITKINAEQKIPGGGEYKASSKLVYKNMTYGMVLRGGYSRYHSGYSVGEDTYRNVWYDGVPYENITRQYDSHPWSREDDMSVSLSARYLTDKVRVTHNASFAWSRDPGSGSHASELWNPSLFNSVFSRSQSRSRSVSPQVAGDYAWQLTDKSMLSTGWNYSYARRNSDSRFQEGDLAPIYNSNYEDVNTAGINLSYVSQLGSQFFLGANASSDMTWFSTHYAGSTNMLQRQWRGNTSASVNFQWKPKWNLSVTLSPEVTASYWHVEGTDKETEVNPSVRVDARWVITRHLMLDATLAYFRRVPGASQSGNVLLRQSELEWLMGNSGLKSTTTWWPMLHCMWMPTQNIRIFPSCSYSRDDNEFITIYEAAPADMGGIIRTYANAEPSETYAWDLHMAGDFLDNKLSIWLQPNWRYTRTQGIYADHLSYFRMRGGISYTLKNCRFSVDYGGQQKYLQNGGMERVYMKDCWNFIFTYGTGDIYLQVWYHETFRKHSMTVHELQSDVFSSARRSFGLGRSVSISLTYTFGYGKKVDRDINVKGPSTVQTGVLGSGD